MYFVLGTICLRIYLVLVFVQNESTILSFRILKWFLSNSNSYYIIVILGKAYYFILSSMQANYLVNLTHATYHKDSAQNAFYWLVVQFYVLLTPYQGLRSFGSCEIWYLEWMTNDLDKHKNVVFTYIWSLPQTYLMLFVVIFLNKYSILSTKYYRVRLVCLIFGLWYVDLTI